MQNIKDIKHGKIFKRALSLLCVIALMFSFLSLPMGSIKAKAAEGRVVYVQLYPGVGNGLNNYNAINNVVCSSDGVTPLTIILPAGGTYYIDTTTGYAFRLRSNTTVDLNGCTLMRSGDLIRTNFFQCANAYGDKTGTGYYMAQNITIKNGTLNGQGFASNAIAVNMLNFGHATNINILNVHLYNSYEGHLIEFSGCQNCTVENCVFSGFYGTPNGGSEALQLDISKTGWNGAYTADSSVCRNMLIKNCTFYDYPTGVGNHHTLSEKHHNQNITITGCNFYNSYRWSTLGPAIRAYSFDNSNIYNNNIEGIYSEGIRIAGGNASFTDNRIDLKNTAGSIGIFSILTGSFLYYQNPPSTKAYEYVYGGRIENNIITNYGRFGMYFSNYSCFDSLNKNTVIRGTGTGVLVESSSITGGVHNNHVSKCRYYDSTSPGNGIHITPSSTVTSMTGNTAGGCSGIGMCNYTHSYNVIMLANKFNGNRGGTYVAWSGSGYNTSLPNNVSPPALRYRSNKIAVFDWPETYNCEGYIITRSTDGGAYVRLAKQWSDSFTDSTIGLGHTYVYHVYAYKTVNGSEWSSSSPAVLTVNT